MKKLNLFPYLFGGLFCLVLALGACKEDPCDTVTCLNGGTCAEGLGTCQCQPGFEGDSCEVNIFQAFLGLYDVSYEGCFATSPNHQVGIEQVSGQTEVFLNDLGDYACPGGRIQVRASITGNSLSIPEQDINCNGEIIYTFQGSGNLSGGVLTLSFTVKYDADGIMKEDSCTATLEKR